MKGYVIAEVDVRDADAYEEYKRHVPPTLEAFGGRFLVRGGPTELPTRSSSSGSGSAPGRV